MGADAGKLRLGLTWDGQVVRKVDIASTRPQAFRLLKGQKPEQAVQMARLLFNVCGNAQGAAAAAAAAAAQGVELDGAALERSIACEAMQEHLWRLLLDWPKLLGLPQQQADFVRWHGMLRDLGAGQGGMAALRKELETRWLGCLATHWVKGNLAELQTWWQAGESPAARLLAALDQVEPAAADSSIAMLPDWTAAQALAACGDELDAEFAARPVFHGVAAETGALGYYAEKPLLHEIMQQRSSRWLARVMARVLDMLSIVVEEYRGRLDSTGMSGAAGLATVKTARGLLMHRVRLEAGKVGDYLAVAPTEWNFHPQGAVVAGLEGMLADSREKLAHLARVHVLSLDPCVEYSIEINGSAV